MGDSLGRSEQINFAEADTGKEPAQEATAYRLGLKRAHNFPAITHLNSHQPRAHPRRPPGPPVPRGWAVASGQPAAHGPAVAGYLPRTLDRLSRADLALAAYNAGPTVVERLGRAPNSESLSYVANVQQRWSALAGCS
mgnify:CR=1 FL=1